LELEVYKRAFRGDATGVKQDVADVGAFDEGDFFISALLRDKKDGFKWEVVVVYGPAHGIWGVVIINTRKMNDCLLMKWIWKIG
jgi:hypothetical protein